MEQEPQNTDKVDPSQAANIFSDDEGSSIHEPPVEPASPDNSCSDSLERELMKEIDSSMNVSPAVLPVNRRLSTADSSPQPEKLGQKEQMLKISSDSDLQEINGQEFEKDTPDKKMETCSVNRSLPFSDRLDMRDSNRGFASEVLTDFADPNTYREAEMGEKNQLSYFVCHQNWWTDQDPENQANSIVVCNIEPRVDEEILYELFCKVGPIKRMKLYRISRKDIEGSAYLQTLDFTHGFGPRPHKKKAVIEYYDPETADAAKQAFDGIELYGKKVFVIKRREGQTKHCLVIIRPIEMNPWLDEFFCLDYFSRTIDLIQIFPKKYQNNQIRYFLYFNSEDDLEKSKELIKRDLKQYLNKKIKIFSNQYENAENNPNKLQAKAKQHAKPSPPKYFGLRENTVYNFPEVQSAGQRGMEVE